MKRSLFATSLVLLACQSTGVVPDATVDPQRDASAAFDGDTALTKDFVAEPFDTSEPERSFAEPELVLRPGVDYRALIETDVGAFTVDLFEEDAPLAVNSFVFLARRRFFEGLAFHRVIDAMVAESGDPTTAVNDRNRWGTGGPGYQFETETTPLRGFDDRGTLGLSRSASRNSNGSRFFITLGPLPAFNGQYTAFGQIVDGLAVLDALARNPNVLTAPQEPSRLVSVTILQRSRATR
jgi:peptidylprolyl isomerase